MLLYQEEPSLEPLSLSKTNPFLTNENIIVKGDFVCCEAGFTSEDVAAAGVEHNDDWHDDHRDEHSECPPEWVGGFKCVSRNDCQNNPFARVNPSACYTASWDGDELCCGQTEDACCQVRSTLVLESERRGDRRNERKASACRSYLQYTLPPKLGLRGGWC